MREIARRVGCSPQLLSFFESGQSLLGDEKLRAYAKAVLSTEEQVRRDFLLEAARYHSEQAKKAREALKGILGKERRVALAK